MRRQPTEPERRLWMVLRDSRLSGYKFRRQVVVGRRIVDFFCPAKALVVELDGETHDRAADLYRDANMIRRYGFVTIRFTNADVMTNLDGVKLALLDALRRQPDRWSARRSPPPYPLL